MSVKKNAVRLFAVMSLALAASAASAAPEQRVVRWNYGTSGNVLVTIAENKGYFKDEGLTIEPVLANANADAMTLLATGKVDVVSNSGTAAPLQQIAAGIDLTIFGGHMVTGCMPVIARAGVEWNGVQSLIGKKFACNPSYFAFTGAVMDLGYKDPLKAVNWVTYSGYNEALAAVVRGEVDYALMGTGQNFNVKKMNDVKIVTYQSEVMPNYSCCRMEAQTEYVKKNPETIKAVLRALLRAQSYYESHRDEAVAMLAKKIGASDEYVAAYMLDTAHYVVNADPLSKSVIRAWGILDKTGFLSENARNIKIEDHIDTELYRQALADVSAAHGSEDPAFYERQRAFFEENN